MKLKSLKSRLIWFHHLDKNFVDRFLAIIASLEVLVESRREYLWWPSSRRNWRVKSRSESTFFLMASDFFRINSWKCIFSEHLIWLYTVVLLKLTLKMNMHFLILPSRLSRYLFLEPKTKITFELKLRVFFEIIPYLYSRISPCIEPEVSKHEFFLSILISKFVVQLPCQKKML